MAQLTWVFNNASGSDDWCSGAGPGNGLVPSGVPMSGVNASFSGSVVTLDGSPDLSTFNAATWGLWMRTVSGRQFYELSGFNNSTKTVTCVNAPSGLASGLQWAIGGKRKTIDGADSRQLMTNVDLKGTWSIYLEDDQTITNVITFYNSSGTNANFRVYGPANRVTITQTANANHFALGATSGSSYQYLIENLKFVNSNATKTSAIALNNAGTAHVRAKNCVFSDSTNKLLNGIKCTTQFSASAYITVEDCLFDTCTGAGVNVSSSNNNQGGQIFGCTFRFCNNASSDNGQIEQGGNNRLTVENCIIHGGSKNGIYIANATFILIRNNVIHSNTGASSDGIQIAAIGGTGTSMIAIYNNNITANGRYGINVPATNYYHSGGLMPQMFIDFNNFGTGSTANSSGARNNLTGGSKDMSVDPQYINTGLYNFATGANVASSGFPESSHTLGGNPASGTIEYVDIGMQQQPSSATVSSSTLPIIKSKFNEGFN